MSETTRSPATDAESPGSARPTGQEPSGTRPGSGAMAWAEYVEALPPGKLNDLARELTDGLDDHPSPTAGGGTPQDTFLLEWDNGGHHFEIEIIDRGDRGGLFEWFYLEPERDPGAGEGTMAEAIEAASRYLPRMARSAAG